MRVITRRGPFHFYGLSAFVLWTVTRLLRLVITVLVLGMRRPWAVVSLALAGVGVWAVLVHPVPTGVAAVGVAEGLNFYSICYRDSWERHAAPWFRARWRWFWTYRRQWQPAMTLTELDAPGPDGTRVLPQLGRVRCRGDVDEVRVRAVLGQHPEQWKKAAPMLAHIYRAASCRVRKGDDRRLTLEFVQQRTRGRSWGDRPTPSP